MCDCGDTSWEIRNDNGNVLISKNPISKNSETTETCSPEGKCVFNVCNAIGNGFQHCDDFLHPDDDHHPKANKNRWSYNDLKNLCTGRTSPNDCLSLLVSNPTVISKLGDSKVMHPIFGQIEKSGWDKMKKGVEMTFPHAV